MYYAASLIAALLVTVFLVSQIAKMLHAKRSDMGRVLLASLLGLVFATVAMALLNAFVIGLDPMMMLVASVVVILIVSSAAFKYINQMNWGAAITTNIANVAIGLMTAVTAIYFNGQSLDETIASVTSTAKTNTQLIGSVASGEMNVTDVVDVVESQKQEKQAALEEEAENAFNEELQEEVFTEKDFLPPGAAKALEAKQKRVYVEPKFHVISISSIHSAVGKKIRIKKTNGNTVLGFLKGVSGSDAVVSRKLSGAKGVAVTPISLAKIRKLEVYR